MSGARGGGQSFGIRLSLDGADAVEGALRRVQASAAQTGTAVQAAGESTGRMLTVIDRGASAASQGLQKLGGDFAALGPIVENAGGSVGRLVTALGSGAGLLGVLGAVGAAVGVAVTLYQNWDTVTRAVGTAVDTLTGRVRANEQAINDANAALRSYLQLSETAAQAGNRRFIEQQRSIGAAAEGRLPGLQAEVTRLERALEAARAGGGTARSIQRGGASGLVPTDEFGTAADRAVTDRLAQRNQNEALRLEGELARARAALEGQRRIVAGTEASIAGAVQDQANVNPGRLPDEPAAARAARGGGGGASRVNDALREREALIQRNQTADERYAAGLSRIADLNDRLIAQGNDPLPDDVVQREAARLMEEYERATRSAADATGNLAQESRDLERAGQAAAKALAGAFEDLVFEGQNFDDVLKNLERSLLRIGNQYLLQPLFQQGLNALFGGGGGGGTGGGAGLIGQGVQAGLSAFGFGGGGSAKLAVDALQAAGTIVSFFHDGGVVGAGGAPTRVMPASLFANAPRFHGGGYIGPDEVPAILQRGERVLTAEQDAAMQAGRSVTINVNGVRDVQGFNASRGQILSDISRAVSRGGRNL